MMTPSSPLRHHRRPTRDPAGGVPALAVKHEPEGLAAGDIARALAVPQNTMSAHLSILSRAGLVSAQRFSRSIVYRADLERFQSVML